MHGHMDTNIVHMNTNIDTHEHKDTNTWIHADTCGICMHVVGTCIRYMYRHIHT